MMLQDSIDLETSTTNKSDSTKTVRITPLGNLHDWVSDCRAAIRTCSHLVLDLTGLEENAFETISAMTSIELALLNEYLRDRLFCEIPDPVDFDFQVLMPNQNDSISRHLIRLGLDAHFTLAPLYSQTFGGEGDGALASGGWTIVPLTQIDNGLGYLNAINTGKTRLTKILPRSKNGADFIKHFEQSALVLCENVIRHSSRDNNDGHGLIASQIIGRTVKTKENGYEEEVSGWYDLTIAVGDIGIGLGSETPLSSNRIPVQNLAINYLEGSSLKPVAYETINRWGGMVQVSNWDCILFASGNVHTHIKNVYPVTGLRVAVISHLKLREV